MRRVLIENTGDELVTVGVCSPREPANPAPDERVTRSILFTEIPPGQWRTFEVIEGAEVIVRPVVEGAPDAPAVAER